MKTFDEYSVFRNIRLLYIAEFHVEQKNYSVHLCEGGMENPYLRITLWHHYYTLQNFMLSKKITLFICVRVEWKILTSGSRFGITIGKLCNAKQ